MKNVGWAVLLGIAAALAPHPAALASGTAPRATEGAPPRLASAKPSPAAASVRRSPSGHVPALIGDSAGTPAEKMADSIAEYYVSGKLRLY